MVKFIFRRVLIDEFPVLNMNSAIKISRLTITVTPPYKTYMNLADTITPCVQAHISLTKI